MRLREVAEGTEGGSGRNGQKAGVLFSDQETTLRSLNADGIDDFRAVKGRLPMVAVTMPLQIPTKPLETPTAGRQRLVGAQHSEKVDQDRGESRRRSVSGF